MKALLPRIMAILAATAALASCQRSSAGPPLATLPSDADLRGIPAGAPPGGGPSPASAINNPFEGNAAAVEDGKALFGAMNCVYCHGANAGGLMGPPLDGQGWRYGGTPAELYNSIHDGRPGGMPAWGARLPPDQIWKLVAYLESLGGAKPPATTGMVKIGGPNPSTTGAQPAGESPADAAALGLARSQKQGR